MHRQTLNTLYSLYDALVSINVPTDKARAVVDAMEQDLAGITGQMQLLQQSLDYRFASVEDKIGQSLSNMTVRIGGMMVVGVGALFGALKLV